MFLCSLWLVQVWTGLSLAGPVMRLRHKLQCEERRRRNPLPPIVLGQMVKVKNSQGGKNGSMGPGVPVPIHLGPQRKRNLGKVQRSNFIISSRKMYCKYQISLI